MSLLAEDLLKASAALQVTAIDFSEPAIQHMVERQQQAHHLDEKRVDYLCMDALNLSTLADNSFDCIVEKGTLDALLTNECVIGSVSEDFLKAFEANLNKRESLAAKILDARSTTAK